MVYLSIYFFVIPGDEQTIYFASKTFLINFTDEEIKEQQRVTTLMHGHVQDSSERVVPIASFDILSRNEMINPRYNVNIQWALKA